MNIVTYKKACNSCFTKNRQKHTQSCGKLTMIYSEMGN